MAVSLYSITENYAKLIVPTISKTIPRTIKEYTVIEPHWETNLSVVFIFVRMLTAFAVCHKYPIETEVIPMHTNFYGRRVSYADYRSSA